MSFIVSWSRERHELVSTAAELDAVLDAIDSGGVPTSVGLCSVEQWLRFSEVCVWDEPPSALLEFGIGHPDRSFVIWSGPDAAVAAAPAAGPWPAGAADIAFDYGGDAVFAGAGRACIMPAAAREAARQFVHTGRRPTCVEWAQQV